eukprot:128711-Rhodomonas_salina.1
MAGRFGAMLFEADGESFGVLLFLVQITGSIYKSVRDGRFALAAVVLTAHASSLGQQRRDAGFFGGRLLAI